MAREVRGEKVETLKVAPDEQEQQDERRAALAQAQARETELRGQLRDALATRSEIEQRLAGRGEELDAAIRHLAALESAISSLERATHELRDEAREARADRAELLDRIAMLTQHNEGLERTLAEQERRSGQLRSAVEQLEGELGWRRTRLDELERERPMILDALRRIAGSRAWRLGHGLTRLLRTITFRRMRTTGALDALIKRLETPAALPPSEQEPTGQPEQQPH